MERYETVKESVEVTLFEASDADPDVISDIVTETLSEFGELEIRSCRPEGCDMELEAELTLQALHTYIPATWGYNGGTPEEDTIETGLDTDSVVSVFRKAGYSAQVFFKRK